MPTTIVPDRRQSTKAMREERANLATRIKEMADKVNNEKRDFNGEEQANWEKLNADYDGLTKRIERTHRLEDIETEQRTVVGDPTVGREDRDHRHGGDGANLLDVPSEEQRNLALNAWCRAQYGLDLTERHEEAARACKVKPDSRDYRFNLLTTKSSRQFRSLHPEKRALSAFVNVSGGHTVPQGFVNNLEIALLAYANVREWADVIRTDEGNDLPWPNMNDTTNKGARLTEAQNVSINVQPSFGQTVLHAYKYTSQLVQVPTELLQDSAFDIAEMLAEALGIRIGRIQADEFTTGTGGSMPSGYVFLAPVGVTTASPTAIAADEIYNLKHSVDPWYRPGAVWTFHDQVLLYIKKLKDGNGRYLWQSSMADGVPDTLDGDKIGINQSMANSVAASNITMAYGQMKKVKVRDVAEVRMLRLVERYADQDLTGFVMFMRSDCNTIDAGTHPIKTMQQHS